MIVCRGLARDTDNIGALVCFGLTRESLVVVVVPVTPSSETPYWDVQLIGRRKKKKRLDLALLLLG